MASRPTAPYPHLDVDLIDADTADDLADLYKVLANGNRLRILHEIHRRGEAGTSALAEALGTSQQVVSNQLQRLADQGIVAARRDGPRVHYRIVDPCVPGLMDLGLCLRRERR